MLAVLCAPIPLLGLGRISGAPFGAIPSVYGREGAHASQVVDRVAGGAVEGDEVDCALSLGWVCIGSAC